MATEGTSFLTFEPGSWCEVMAALAPFLLLGVFPAILNPLRLYAIAPKWSGIAITLTSLGLVLGLFLIGQPRAFPAGPCPIWGCL